MERCDHPGRRPAPSRVKRPLAARKVQGPVTGGPTVKQHAAHGAACPGLLIRAMSLLIEVQPPVGPSQRGRGKRSPLDNYYVT